MPVKRDFSLHFVILWSFKQNDSLFSDLYNFVKESVLGSSEVPGNADDIDVIGLIKMMAVMPVVS